MLNQDQFSPHLTEAAGGPVGGKGSREERWQGFRSSEGEVPERQTWGKGGGRYWGADIMGS